MPDDREASATNERVWKCPVCGEEVPIGGAHDVYDENGKHLTGAALRKKVRSND